MAHAESLRINISITDMHSIADMHRLTVNIFDVSNAFQNTHISIHERVCASTPPYDIYWFETSYPNIPLNQDDGSFFLQCMNGIQVKNYLDENVIDSLMQWLQSWSIRKHNWSCYINQSLLWWICVLFYSFHWWCYKQY